jgi:C-terminal processing protease CtpA/Prc
MMKYLYVFLFLISGFLVSAACSAEEKWERHIQLFEPDEKVGLGVAILDLDEEKQKELGIEKGALVAEVIENSEAERIGLKKDDVIIEFDGKKIDDAEALHNIIEESAEKGKKVSLVVFRDKVSKKFEAELNNFKPKKVHIKIDGDDFKDLDYTFSFEDEDFDFLMLPDKKAPIIWNHDEKGGFLGVKGKNLSKQMLEYFEVDFGVLVETVYEKTPAEKAGIKAGDVIVRINDRDIKDFADLVRTLNYYNPGEEIKVYFVRKGKSKKVTIELEKKDHKLMRYHFPHAKNLFFKVMDNADSLKDLKKKMKVIKKKIKKPLKELEDINIDIDLYLI